MCFYIIICKEDFIINKSSFNFDNYKFVLKNLNYYFNNNYYYSISFPYFYL